MSLVIALKSQGGIVLGADSRGTIGDPRGLTAIRDTQIKLYPFGKCGIGLTGASEIGNTVLDELQNSWSKAKLVFSANTEYHFLEA